MEQQRKSLKYTFGALKSPGVELPKNYIQK